MDGEPTDRQLLRQFADRQDPSAFATLIQRHGPVVLGVCRRVLNHEQEAEDAFQATFLVLVRKAGSLERPELLGNWLYGVAYRTAQKARARLARRRHHERSVPPMAISEPESDLFWQDLRGLLDDELRQLPPKYRLPLVLCYLEGMTNHQAAQRLGWPVGSMSYRLARGRQMLRQRLRARRQMLSGMFVLALLERHAAPAQVPSRLADTTLRAALGVLGRRPPEFPPNPPMLDVPAKTSWARPRGFGWWRAALAIVATTVIVAAAAGGVAYTGGFGGASAAAAPVQGTLDGAPASAVPPSCH